MAILQLRKAVATQPPQPSTERIALAERIAARDAARHRLTALRGAVDRAWSNISTARDARDTAAAAVDHAATADARAVIDAMINGDDAPALTLPAARTALAAAADALAAAGTMRATIEADIAKLAEGESLREMLVDAAAVAVLRAEGGAAIRALVAELDAQFRRLIDQGLALSALMRHGILDRVGPAAIPNALEMSCHFDNMIHNWPLAQTPGASPTALAWEATIAALKVDATAPAVLALG